MYIIVYASYTFSILPYLRIHVCVVSVSVSVSGHHRCWETPQYIVSGHQQPLKSLTP